MLSFLTELAVACTAPPMELQASKLFVDRVSRQLVIFAFLFHCDDDELARKSRQQVILHTVSLLDKMAHDLVAMITSNIIGCILTVLCVSLA
jgi:hypothetical protein